MSVFKDSSGQKGMTSVEYAVIVVMIILTIVGTVLWLANPADPFNSVLPGTYNAVGGRVGNYGLVNLPAN